MQLQDGSTWTIPITLDITPDDRKKIRRDDEVFLRFENVNVAKIEILDIFEISKKSIYKLFQTRDHNHPGVSKELKRSSFRVGCKINWFDKKILNGALNPKITKKHFNAKGWKTIVGFQTRNPVHRAHEYLQRLGLEFCDGLLINPLVGWKKVGDFSEPAIQSAYRVMLDDFYPRTRVHFTELRTQMRYAGPKEAIFHAIVRRNLGCTHFIIGRDHAGVGNYYGIYEAHTLARKLVKRGDLGITLLLMKEPYYCIKCQNIVTENHCSHYETDRLEVSGSLIRADLSQGKIPDVRMMRPEVAKEIIKLGKAMFVGEKE